MRVLTVQQPAAGAILALGKVTENRTWATAYRGPVAIHAGKAIMPPGHPFWRFAPYRSALAAATAQQRDALDHRGVIIALADLVDVHEAASTSCCSPWGESEVFAVHWMLENIRPLAVPVAHKGGLGLRHLDEAVEAAVLREVNNAR